MYLFFIFPIFLLPPLSLSSPLFPVASLWIWWVLMTASGYGSDSGGFDGGGSNSGWGWLRPWVEAMGCRSGLRWGSGLLGWWVLWRFCGGFSLRFVPWVFFFFLGGWGLRLWLVVVAVAMTMAMVRGDELEKLRPWRFWEQILERGRSFSVCAVGFFFWWLRLWLVVVAMAVAVAVVYRWWAWKGQAMEVLRANIRGREKLHQVEKDGKTVGEWEIIKKNE